MRSNKLSSTYELIKHWEFEWVFYGFNLSTFVWSVGERSARHQWHRTFLISRDRSSLFRQIQELFNSSILQEKIGQGSRCNFTLSGTWTALSKFSRPFRNFSNSRKPLLKNRAGLPLQDCTFGGTEMTSKIFPDDSLRWQLAFKNLARAPAAPYTFRVAIIANKEDYWTGHHKTDYRTLLCDLVGMDLRVASLVGHLQGWVGVHLQQGDVVDEHLAVTSCWLIDTSNRWKLERN